MNNRTVHCTPQWLWVYWNLKSLDETLVCDRYADVSSGTVYYAVQRGSNFWVLVCDHSNESYWAERSCGTVYCAVQGGSKFWLESVDETLVRVTIRMKAACNFTPGCLLYRLVQGSLWARERNPSTWPFKRKLLKSTFHEFCSQC